jgi:hypothetical protein
LIKSSEVFPVRPEPAFDGSNLVKIVPFALSLSKGFDELSPNG